MNFEKAKDICRALPGCTEDVKWTDNLVFSVGEKMFAITNADGPADGFSFKVDDDRFLEMTDRPGITPTHYMARAKWVTVDKSAKMSDKEGAELLRRSYELVFAKLTKKLQREIGEGQ
jgi:predicted DNA-binding protein (MmcQ/YjbR family)